MKRFILPVAILAATAALGWAGMASAQSAGDAPAISYDAEGKMNFPADYRKWMYLSSGFDMAYTEVPNRTAHVFDNVFVNRESYDAFVKDGVWPDKTVLVLEVRGADNKDVILKDGMFQGGDEPRAEAHVKDAAKGGWAFYAFGKTRTPAAMLPKTASCFACHEKNAATDTTFTQFYPTLRDVKKAP